MIQVNGTSGLIGAQRVFNRTHWSDIDHTDLHELLLNSDLLDIELK